MITNESITLTKFFTSTRSSIYVISLKDTILFKRYIFYLTFENSPIQSWNLSSTSCCQSFKTEDVRTKCFSSLLINGVGNFSYTVSLSAIRMSLHNNNCYINVMMFHLALRPLLEIFMHSALHSVSLQSKVNVSVVSIVHIVLVQHIIQAFIQVFQIE